MNDFLSEPARRSRPRTAALPLWALFQLGVASGYVFFASFTLAAVPLWLMALAPLGFFWPARYSELMHVLLRSGFRLLLLYLRSIGVLTLRFVDRRSDKSSPPRVIVANHVSFLDVVIIVALFPKCYSLVKGSVAKNPLLGWIIRGAGFISIDSGVPETRVRAFEQMLELIKSGRTLVVFPEGTRSPDGRLGPFNKGLFKALMMAQTDLSPVVLSVSEPFLGKGPWWKIFANSGRTVHYRISLFDLLQTPTPEQPRPRDLKEFMERAWSVVSDRLDRQHSSGWMRMTNSFLYAGEKVTLSGESDRRISAEYSFLATHPHFDGHFDGFPILPAVGQMDFLQAVARQWLGGSATIVRVSRAKFQAPILPGTSVRVDLCRREERADPSASGFEWHITAGDQTISRGHLLLAQCPRLDPGRLGTSGSAGSW